MSATGPIAPESAAEQFYGAALRRIRRFILILGAVGFLASFVRFGTVVAAGFLLGSIIAYVNHVWLERMIGALGERITTGQSRERGGIIVVRAVLRSDFIALGAYFIFRVSLEGL